MMWNKGYYSKKYLYFTPARACFFFRSFIIYLQKQLRYFDLCKAFADMNDCLAYNFELEIIAHKKQMGLICYSTTKYENNANLVFSSCGLIIIL